MLDPKRHILLCEAKWPLRHPLVQPSQGWTRASRQISPTRRLRGLTPRQRQRRSTARRMRQAHSMWMSLQAGQQPTTSAALLQTWQAEAAPRRIRARRKGRAAPQPSRRGQPAASGPARAGRRGQPRAAARHLCWAQQAAQLSPATEARLLRLTARSLPSSSPQQPGRGPPALLPPLQQLWLPRKPTGLVLLQRRVAQALQPCQGANFHPATHAHPSWQAALVTCRAGPAPPPAPLAWPPLRMGVQGPAAQPLVQTMRALAVHQMRLSRRAPPLRRPLRAATQVRA
jgi:hypothetical protein